MTSKMSRMPAQAKKYGLPYMGSKSSTVKDMLQAIPCAENFYDLFGGGGCVSHYAAENCKDKWKYVHYNEFLGDVAGLIEGAINGKYSYKRFKPPFVSREEFFKNKDRCAYTRCIYSFGNNQKDYLFSKKIEPYKRSLHQAVVFNEFNDIAIEALGTDRWPDNMLNIRARRLFVRRTIKERTGELQQLERLERLEQLERLERSLIITALDYQSVVIQKNSVVYCDIPYQGTSSYLSEFNYQRFFDWAAKSKHPVFVSEFEIKDPRFVCIFKKAKKQKLSSNSKSGTRKEYIERLYANSVAVDLLSRTESKPIDLFSLSA